jgi:hypothetical protein
VTYHDHMFFVVSFFMGLAYLRPPVTGRTGLDLIFVVVAMMFAAWYAEHRKANDARNEKDGPR